MKIRIEDKSEFISVSHKLKWIREYLNTHSFKLKDGDIFVEIHERFINLDISRINQKTYILRFKLLNKAFISRFGEYIYSKDLYLDYRNKVYPLSNTLKFKNEKTKMEQDPIIVFGRNRRENIKINIEYEPETSF